MTGDKSVASTRAPPAAISSQPARVRSRSILIIRYGMSRWRGCEPSPASWES